MAGETMTQYRVIPPEDTDAYGLVNNVVFVHWMQELAEGHSRQQGWPLERYQQLGLGWEVRFHHIEYKRPAFADEALVEQTWVGEMDRVSCTREYRFYRQRDQRLLVAAQTCWVLVDLHFGRPQALSEQLQ